MDYAGIGRRLVAFVIDIIPIIVLVTLVYFFLVGFDPAESGSGMTVAANARANGTVLQDRSRIRDGSLIVWLLYSALLEASPLRGTLGKRWLGIKVVDASGAPLTLGKSMARNASKVLSFLPLGLGFAWALFRSDRRTWHDLIAGTYVIRLQAWD
jgi:uncharacterized RDD family membrane protein YckC